MTRYPFLDFIRVAACYLVIVLHVAAINFYVFSPTWMINVFWDSLSRMCVPLFLMISGFLFMDQEIRSIGQFYVKRCLRILVPFAAVCVFYFFTPTYADYSLGKYFVHISIINFADYHLWYVYALLPLYLALPFFMKIFSGPSGPSYIKYYLIIWILICVIGNTLLCYFFPEIRKHFELFTTNLYYFYIFMGYLVFGFMGYFLCGLIIKKTYTDYGLLFLIFNMLIFVGATAAIIYFTWFHSHNLGKPNELFFENLSPFVVCQTVSFFILCSSMRKERPLLRRLADKTFWIYLLHLLWLRMLLQIFPLPANSLLIAAIPALALLVFATAWLTAIPLRAAENWLLGLPRKAHLLDRGQKT